MHHWYSGVLAGAATHRVFVTEDDHDVLVRAVRGWPALDRLLTDVGRHVPDRFGAGIEASSLIV